MKVLSPLQLISIISCFVLFLFITTNALINPSNPSSDTTTWDLDNEIWFAQSAPLTGPSKRLGIEMRDGILTAFNEFNALGGVFGGKKLKLLTLDDAYEPTNTKVNTNLLLYNITPPNTSTLNQAIFNNSIALDEVKGRKYFGLIGFVGTPTVQNVFTDVLSQVWPLIGSFTGVGWLRTPFYPNIINIRASYDDETAAMVEWLVNVKLIRRISIMYQNDAFGNAGLSGINRSLVKRLNISLCSSGTFPRNTLQVEDAFNTIGKCNPEAIVLIGTYAPLSKYIRLVKDVAFSPYNSTLGYSKANQITFLTVSFVGSSALTEDLSSYQPPSLAYGKTYYTDNVVISQVVPSPMDTSYPIVSSYQRSRKEYAKNLGLDPSLVSFTFIELEGYLVGKLVFTVLKNMIGSLTRSNFIASIYFDFTSGVSDVTNAGGYFNFESVQVGRYKYCNAVNLYDHFLSPSNQTVVSGSCSDNCNQGLKIIYLSNIELKNNTNIRFNIFRDFSWYDTQKCISDTAQIQKQIIIGQSILSTSLRDQFITVGINAALSKRNSNYTRNIELKTLYHDDSASMLKNVVELKTLHESVAFVGVSAESINLDSSNTNSTIDIRGYSEFSNIPLFGVRSTNSMVLRNTFVSSFIHVFPSIMDQLGTVIDYSMKNGENRISIVYSSSNSNSVEVRQLLKSILDSIGIETDSEVDATETISLDSIINQLSSNTANPHSIFLTLSNPDQILSIISQIKKTYSNSSPLFRKGLSVYLINSLFDSSVEAIFSTPLSLIVDENLSVKYVSHLPGSYNSTLQVITDFENSMDTYFPSINYRNNTAYLEGYIIGAMISAFIDSSGGNLDAKGLLNYMYTVQQVTSAGVSFGKLSVGSSPCSLGLRTNYIYAYNQKSQTFSEFNIRNYDMNGCGLVKYKNSKKRAAPTIDISSLEQPLVFARLIPFSGDESLSSSKLSLLNDVIDADDYSKGLSSYINVYNTKTTNQKIQIRTEYFGFTDSRWSLETKVKNMITRQKVFAFVTGFSSDEDFATIDNIKQILTTYDTPMLTTSNSLELRKPFSKYFINMKSSVLDEVASQISYFKNYGSIAIIYHNIPYWTNQSIPLIAEYLEYNSISISLIQGFSGSSDFSSLGVKLQEGNIQSIVLISGSSMSASFISSLIMYQTTYTPNIGILSEAYNNDFVSKTFTVNNYKSALFAHNFLYLSTITFAPKIYSSDICSLSTSSLHTDKQNSFISLFMSNYNYNSTATHMTLEGYSTGFFIETLLNRIYQEMGITKLSTDDLFSGIYSAQTFDISGLNTFGPFGLECSSQSSQLTTNQTSSSCNQKSTTTCDCNQAPRKVYLSRVNIVPTENYYTFTDIDYAFDFSSSCGVSVVKPVLSTTAIVLISLAGFFVILLVIIAISIAYVCISRSESNTKNAPKTGNICCCFTDIQNSTVLWEKCEKGMREGLKLHNDVLRNQLNLFKGFEVKTQGDCFYVVFKDPLDGIDWAMSCQHELMSIAWPSELLQMYDCRTEFNNETKEIVWNGIRVRMGLHFGYAEKIFDKVVNRPDYFGNTINAAARIEASTQGGQVLISEDMFSELWKIHGTNLFKSITLKEDNQATYLETISPSFKSVNGIGESKKSKDFQAIFSTKGRSIKYSENTESTKSEDRKLKYHANDLGEFKLKGLQGMIRLFEIKSDKILERKYSENLRNTEVTKLDMLKQGSQLKSTRTILPLN
ncbi:predicted protein [Naegleria gruberi]|uniref:Predicted protein n=1 Tax=Naegleria gruberi TaxID=5762 RepID=D2W0I8_NAEGR|nr:uncharacterized protein NAEGRDRAFT_53734 [Naegleria gruberi]EFC37436.1 predicted protein [Naegleria gruberi]|eukprot:XP_002670180.1 predicted protein [Naegleria gruberi strain NEG-M]